MTSRRRHSAFVIAVALALAGGSCSPPPPPASTAAPPTPTQAPPASPSPSPVGSVEPTPTASLPPGGHTLDGRIDLAGLRHDSRDLTYRTPAGAVPAGTTVLLRLRTFFNDVSGVKLRLFSVNANEEQLIPMVKAAENATCYDQTLIAQTCDYWQAALGNADADNLWYRFIVNDGTATAYYGDDTPALDGGMGAATEALADQSWALTVYEPDFRAPSWASSAVMYQIFPDRFRNGDPSNDPQTGDVRYDDPVLKLDWDELPEGYCRGYADSSTNCPWRFEDNPPDWSPTVEGPRNRDYMGGDLAGVIEKLDYLQALGVTVIYFNPIFDAASNHGYDTQDYGAIDPYFGTNEEFVALIDAADERGIKVILDGVFNHMSSDSEFFDRYGHYDALGACESIDAPRRLWFRFLLAGPEGGPCAAPGGPDRMVYDSWFGFDSIPTISKTREDVLEYFVSGDNSIAKRWLRSRTGPPTAAGWRMDVSGDPSFPDGYWEAFRSAVKSERPDALTISETWQKDSALLRALRGDRFDTTMNYRLRDAVLGFMTPTGFDAKGFPDSGRQLAPTEFANRLLSMREDYAPAAYFSLMNLLDSHDTERALWALTPGEQTTAGREQDAANLDEGKARLKVASLLQFTVPGMPSIFYGDEVGVTGQTDPDGRRTYPWADQGGTPDEDLLAHYTALAGLRRDVPALNDGDLRVLLADDGVGALAVGRRTVGQAVVVAVNRSDTTRELAIPVSSFVPDGTSLAVMYQTSGVFGEAIPAAGGQLTLSLEPLSGVVLATTTGDFEPPAAPEDLSLQEEGDGRVTIAWQPATEAIGYNVYRSPLSGGGWFKVNDGPLTETTFTESDLTNARLWYFTVTAVDGAGNESGYAIETAGMPHLDIDEATLTTPESMTHTISTSDPTAIVRAQASDAAEDYFSVTAEFGFGPAGSAPADNPDWTWVSPLSQDFGATALYAAQFLPEQLGAFDYVFRFSSTAGREWRYADLSSIFEGVPAQPGKLTVNASADTTAPAAPGDLRVKSASVLGVDLEWTAVTGDATLYGYELLRGPGPGGPFEKVALVTEPAAHDPNVTSADPIFYIVRAVDTSFNRSADSPLAMAEPGPRPVVIVFNVTVPEPTGPAVGRDVYIAGYLDRLDPGLPQWDPAGVKMDKIDDTHWTISLSGIEGTNIGYKYVLGDWLYVEKDASCAEISDRPLTVDYGQDGTQVVEDVVLNWRNVAGCPN